MANETTETITTANSSINLSLDDVSKAIDEYVDENKPDPLQLKQIRGWTFSFAVEQDDKNHALVWKGEHANVIIHCDYTTTPHSLHFACHVEAVLTSKSAKIKNRLAKDDYIRKINHKQLICQADIDHTNDSMEERFFTDEEIAEAVRRAVWSTADRIDIIDLLGRLYLPSSSSGDLGNRARLRLLEDAMYDACEQEGEEELVEELQISKRPKKS